MKFRYRGDIITKLLLCGFIISCFSFVGYSLSKNEDRQIKSLRALIKFIDHTEKEISEKLSSFERVVASFEHDGEEEEALYELLMNGEGETPSEKLKYAADNTDVNDSVKKHFAEYALAFGRFGIDKQNEMTAAFKQKLIAEYEKQNAEYISKSKMYRSISMLMGAVIAILIY